LRARASGLTEELASTRAAGVRLESELGDVRRQLVETRQQWEAARVAGESAAKELADAKVRVAALQSERETGLRDAAARLEALRGELTAARSAGESAEARSDELRRRVAELQEAERVSAAKLADLGEQLAAALKERESVATRASADAEALRGRLAETEGRFGAQREELARRESALADLNAKVSLLGTELEAAKSAGGVSEREIASLRDQLESSRVQLTAVRAAEKTVSGKLAELGSRLAAALNEREETARQAGAEAEALRTRLAAAEKSVADLALGRDNLQREFTASQESLAALRRAAAEVEELRKRSEVLAQELAQANGNAATAVRDAASLREQLADARNALASARSAQEESSLKLSQTNERLSAMVAER
jgi:chromosome segregation ATPase